MSQKLQQLADLNIAFHSNKTVDVKGVPNSFLFSEYASCGETFGKLKKSRASPRRESPEVKPQLKCMDMTPSCTENYSAISVIFRANWSENNIDKTFAIADITEIGP